MYKDLIIETQGLGFLAILAWLAVHLNNTHSCLFNTSYFYGSLASYCEPALTLECMHACSVVSDFQVVATSSQPVYKVVTR